MRLCLFLMWVLQPSPVVATKICSSKSRRTSGRLVERWAVCLVARMARQARGYEKLNTLLMMETSVSNGESIKCY